ncbi:MAG TPA: CDP-alcohol phosphatidyltransferase family protein [Thermoanaerobaculia bacterium]|nr:CDP-alcohol phosphatidyltransferase family protein [Thermoanaerobaculia bacterium]
MSLPLEGKAGDCRPTAPARSTWHERAYFSIRRGRDRALAPIAALLVAWKVPPAAVSLLGVASALAFVPTFPRGSAWAVAAFFAAHLCDMTDGAVARRSGTSSHRGKRLDHFCDSAAYAALIAGTLLAGAIGPGGALFAVWSSSASLLLGLLDRIDRAGSEAEPAAGFWVHMPKVVFYVPLGLVLVGAPSRLASYGLLAANLFAAGTLATQIGPLLKKR